MAFALWEKVSDFWATLRFGASNSGVTVSSDGPGSMEFRFAALGNPGSPRPWWRVLFNATSGIEVQNASNENFSDALTIIALGAQTNTSLGVAAEGINVDVSNLDGSLTVRSFDGVTALGRLRCIANGQGGFQWIFSARNNSGQLVDLAALDADQIADGALAVKASGADHRLRRDSNGNATLL